MKRFSATGFDGIRRPGCGARMSAKRLFPLIFAIGCAAPAPARALVITSEAGFSRAVEFNSSNNVLQELDADTSAGPADARIRLGDGVNAFAQPAFAEAFGVFRNDQATYWVNLNADNTTSFGDSGIGATSVEMVYNAVKEPGDKAFVLHTTGGHLQIADPDFGRIPLVSRVEIDARVLVGPNVIKEVSAHAELFGNGGPTGPFDNFELLSDGFDIRPFDFFINLDSFGAATNEVGAELRLRPLNIPVDLSNIVDSTPITVSVTLTGEVRAFGAETIASAFFRDPTDIDSLDPFAGASTLTFETLSGVPEPSTWLMLGAGFFGLWGRSLWRPQRVWPRFGLSLRRLAPNARLIRSTQSSPLSGAGIEGA
jgi:PEP-CTERM motif